MSMISQTTKQTETKQSEAKQTTKQTEIKQSRASTLQRPRLQIALDTTDMPSAIRPLNAAISQIDVIECGTILIIAEGLRAVREVRALYPNKTILADVRIAEAGALIARNCFEAGANWVSVVAGASLTTVERVVKVAQEFDGEVQIELGEEYDPDKARIWRRLGAKHVIVHRSRDAEAAGKLTWGADDIARIRELHDMGFTVTITGGVKTQDIAFFKGSPVGVIISGRGIVKAEDPVVAASELNEAIDQVWPQ
ncbi:MULTISPECIES: orotidine 5'-phosphate decarboxylase / HUMPS family protein [Bifidobacterium]|jgi:3-dehydro-L-gulonate-6-phosphate decarboxylase|nr:orotidine 5'-phosphate decarboxylase / HUMPS family protein [Bifidobacterium tibiigranuli]MCH3974069.1 orotidine 5'-phosphate decarboxylase [Bifidobacterium tibiigranuli]MCH4189099.1 orotidine 5'-phosphate decarboxylase [Bifidobacterium tibiigranuli]MCH4204059.1 orotidine 5'-phosphate decarboxylase [Bifidobacterium tibiigranuli]MCH4274434.1 orotidine 5'-phosphate decarboxylase [Bifidobacterium tibiigranuli]MCI1790763.1 orotidine 5'-phosphate decarboxylase [Bifidobacterium tibiigranuli]